MRAEPHSPSGGPEASGAALRAARELALVTGRLLLWTYRPASDEMWWSDDPAEALKLPASADEPDVGRALLRPLLEATGAFEQWTSYEWDRDVADVDGNSATLVVRARAVVGADGELVLGGVLADMTERRSAELALRDLADRYRLLVDLSPDAIVVHQDGIIRFVNDTGYRMMRMTESEQLLGHPIVEFVHPDSIGDMMARISSLDEAGLASSPSAARIVRVDGTVFTVEATSVRTTWNGKPAYQVILRDTSERDDLQHRFESVVGALDEGVVVIDRTGEVSVVNRSARRLLGDRIDGARDGIELLRRLQLTDADGLPIDPRRHPAALALLHGEASQAVLHGAWVAGIGQRWFSANFQPLISSDEAEPSAVVCSFTDITNELEAEARLNYQATHDPLTRLPNRAHLLAYLRGLLDSEVAPVAVLFIDLDRFKSVNDSVGHVDADQVLQVVAGRLVGACRDSEFVGRLAGDEFVVVLRDIESPDEAHAFAERIAARLSEPIGLASGRQVLVTASIGVAVASPGADTIEVDGLVQRADTAMYQAKQAGRNRVEHYHRALHDRSLRRTVLRARLQEDINDDHLSVEYQPVVDTVTGRLRGVEALARWSPEAESVVPPSVFVSIAEEDGLIVALGERILAKSCREFAEWRSQDPARGSLTLAVNLSTRQLGSDAIIDAVVESLGSSGLAATDLWLEVTESVLAPHEDTARRVLDGLRELGVRLAVDDFGTGHSSLQSLQRYPVAMLKIDRSFVAGLGQVAGSEAIVSAVVGLSSSLGLTTVAEGVETEAQRAWLADTGCPLSQGFLFGRPEPLAVLG